MVSICTFIIGQHQEINNSDVVFSLLYYTYIWGLPGGAVVKNQPGNAGDTGDTGSIPGSGRSPGGGNGNPLWWSCLENSMDRSSLVGYSP